MPQSDWIKAIHHFLVDRDLPEGGIAEVLAFIQERGTARNCPYLLDVERSLIETMIPREHLSVSEKVRRFMIAPIPPGRPDQP